jgi:hypothetical protein
MNIIPEECMKSHDPSGSPDEHHILTEIPGYSSLASESALLKDALIRLVALPQGASLDDKKRAIGRQTLKLLPQDKLSSIVSKKNPRNRGLTNSAQASEMAQRLEREESVRQLLRDASTKETVQEAIGLAKELDMSFEIALGERKLSKLVTVSVPTRE